MQFKEKNGMKTKTFNDELLRDDWCMVFYDRALRICLRSLWAESGKDRYQCQVDF